MGSNPRFHKKAAEYPRISQNILDTGVADGRITERDRALIREFVTGVGAERSLTPSRRYKLTTILLGARRFIGPYTELTIADLHEGIERIQSATKDDGTPFFKRNTVADYIRFVKRFVLWLIENGYSSMPEKKVRAIRSPAYDTMTKTVADLLTEEEIRAMIKAAKTPKDQALIALLYEGGFRIGELANLTWGEMIFTDWNLQVNTNEKTGKPRYIPLVLSRPYMAAWRNAYPGDPTGNSFVFVTNIRHEPIQYQGVVKQLRIIAKNAGVTKHITPHVFRHSRITHLIQQGMNESTIKLMMWGNIGTEMFRTYAHLCNADIDRSVAELSGIVVPGCAERTNALVPIQCTRCRYVNRPGARFCDTCGLELTLDAAADKQTAEERIRSDPRFKAWMEAAMKIAPDYIH